MSSDAATDKAPEIICKVDATRIIGPVHRGLFGSNIEWFNNGNNLMKQGRTLDMRMAALAREQGVSLLRFPGGTLSDYYHWEDGIGPAESRPVRPHHTDPGKSKNVFGTPELARFSNAAGAQPLITVNAGTGTAIEAAAWVRYANDPVDPRRKADGFAAPLNIRLWEIGNELYLPGNPGDLKVAVTPEVYAERFLSFSKEMRSAAPDIEILGIGLANSYAVPMEHENWSEVLLNRAAGEMDYLAVHNAYFPMLFVDKGLSTRQGYAALWAGPEAADRSLAKLDALIQKYQQERYIGIAVTEWGALFSFDPEWIDHVKTMGTAVYAARMMQVFLHRPRVKIANYFKLTDNTFMGWIGHDAVPKAPYFAIQMFSRHFGSRVVQSSIQGSPVFVSPALRVMQSEQVPELTSVASLDEKGETLYVNIVSRSWRDTHTVTLDISGFSPAAGPATLWYLTAPAATDHNGRDLPADWPAPFDEPHRTAGFDKAIGIKKMIVDITRPISVPPHTVMTVEIKSRK